MAGADVINLPTGTLSIEGRNEDASVTGDLDIADDLTINGTIETGTIIDANAIDRVLHIIESSIVEISNVAVTGANDDREGDPAAGGILNEGIAPLPTAQLVITIVCRVAAA